MEKPLFIRTFDGDEFINISHIIMFKKDEDAYHIKVLVTDNKNWIKLNISWGTYLTLIHTV